MFSTNATATVLDAIQAQVQERKGVLGGGTIKGLIPSFGEAIPDEGYICKCNRIAFIDEFFSILRRAKQHQELDAGTDLLTNILEHKARPVQSGRGALSYIDVRPRAKCILISNTKNFYKLENMVEIAQSLNNPFLSRVLWYVQTKEHIAFIDQNRAKVKNLLQDSPTGGLPVHDDEFMSVYDFFNSLVVRLDYERTAKVVAQYKSIIPEELHEVFRRYDHHYECLVDGVAKYRYITEVKETLVADEDDYKEAEELFSIILHSWLDSVDVSKMPTIKARINFLNPETRKVFDIVSGSPGITKSLFGTLPDLASKLRNLEELQLVRAMVDTDGSTKKYYPFWHLYVRGDAV